MTLGEFAYFDRQLVEDLLHGTKDRLTTERRQTSREPSPELSGKVQVPGTETDASLFRRLHSHLSGQRLIRSIDTLSQETWDQINRGEILELRGNVEVSAIERLFELSKGALPYLKSMKANEQVESAVRVLELISAQQVINVKVMLREGDWKFLATLPKNKTRATRQELSSSYNVLCQAQRKVDSGETFTLISFALGPEGPRPQIEEFTTNVQSREIGRLLGRKISTEDFVISPPAMMVTPIAIYK